jgi:hypothetical protein
VRSVIKVAAACWSIKALGPRYTTALAPELIVTIATNPRDGLTP